MGRSNLSWAGCPNCFDGPVVLLDTQGCPILDVAQAFPIAWWERSRHTWAAKGPRPRLDPLYPVGLSFQWEASTSIFRRPVPIEGSFSHPAAPATVKWVGRVRCGCLATQDRLYRHHMGPDKDSCLCCGAALEDELHVLSGCSGTGSLDWAASFMELWAAAALHCHLLLPPPPSAWVASHRIPLAAALLPDSSLWHHPLPPSDAQRFLHRLHHLLAERLAE